VNDQAPPERMRVGAKGGDQPRGARANSASTEVPSARYEQREANRDDSMPARRSIAGLGRGS